jgi:periplasmic iron binding protein
VRERWAGPIVVVLILGGVVAVLALNLNLKGRNPADPASRPILPPQTNDRVHTVQPPAPVVRQPAGFREYPIGEEVQKNEMLIKAVWLPPVQMEGMEFPATSNLIHLEADIHATEGNRNGFAKDEFIPYLAIDYTIVAVDEKAGGKPIPPIKEHMIPMVARDGLHYGATIEMPGDGHYKLTYAIKPPSANGLGRHVDSATGVEPFWKPFEVSFDWEFNRKGE